MQDQICIQICYRINRPAAVLNSAERLTAEDMEYLYGEIDDEVIIEICNFGTLAAIFTGASA